MRKISSIDRILLLATGILAGYLIIFGVEGNDPLAVTSYTVAFGVLLIAALLIFILGFEILESRLVVILSTLIPLGISLGLVSEYMPKLTGLYLVFTVLGFLLVVIMRFAVPGRAAVIVLAVVHGIAGLIIFCLPVFLVIQGTARPGFLFVSAGGALIGVGGLLLSFLKAGKPILSQDAILTVFPGLLALTTTAFVIGFHFS